MKKAMVTAFFLSAYFLYAQEYKPQWKPGADSPFEVGTQLRPWTIVDEGMDYILDNCQQMAGVNNIYLVLVMHQEHRPYQAPKFPHNPKRSTFQAEDSRVNFFPEMERYGKIKPRLSDYEWIRNTDWMQFTINACRKRGMGVGAEVSHYPVPREYLLEHPEYLQVDVNGEVIMESHFCPNNPDIREYLRALFGDLAAHYDLDYIQTCQWLYSGKDIQQGAGCFCEHCIRKASEMGIDLEHIRKELKQNNDIQPWPSAWEEFRFRTSTDLYREIAEAIRNENPDCHLRLNDVYSWNADPRKRGLDLGGISKHLGSLVNQDHEEQRGKADEDFSWRKKWLTDNREYLGWEKPLLTGVAPRIHASPELVKRGIKVALEHPARIDGLVLKHYDGASFGLLRAFKDGMIEAGVQGLTPIIGFEAEEMELDNYTILDEELAEDWGVETNGEGQASAIFNEESGVYDVRISYFDHPLGKSKVQLYVDRREVASFMMDEDTDCWRWRYFEGIRIEKGCEIMVKGRADREERAILEFIEFIPVR